MASPYASVALYRRDGAIVFRPARKERPDTATQARKAAQRFWSTNAKPGDTLVKVVVMREFAGKLEISERASNAGKDKPWVDYPRSIPEAMTEPHLAACIKELGVDQTKARQDMPDILEINGVIYRREI